MPLDISDFESLFPSFMSQPNRKWKRNWDGSDCDSLQERRLSVPPAYTGFCLAVKRKNKDCSWIITLFITLIYVKVERRLYQALVTDRAHLFLSLCLFVLLLILFNSNMPVFLVFHFNCQCLPSVERVFLLCFTCLILTRTARFSRCVFVSCSYAT